MERLAYSLFVTVVVLFVTRISCHSPVVQHPHGFPPPSFQPAHFPYYPQPSCDGCTKANLGFQLLLYKLREIYKITKKSCFPESYTEGRAVVNTGRRPFADTPCPSIRTVYGEDSGTNDGDESVATCPDGTKVIACRCSYTDATCDGVLVTDQTCTAVKGLSNPQPIQAIAQCTGNDDNKFTDLTVSGSVQPSLQCPANFDLAECWLLNEGTENGLIQTSIDKDTNTCTTSAACGSTGDCTLTILCQAV